MNSARGYPNPVRHSYQGRDDVLWDGNPHTKHKYRPLSKWRTFLENLSVGDTVVLSVRFYLDTARTPWLSREVFLRGNITDIHKR